MRLDRAPIGSSIAPDWLPFTPRTQDHVDQFNIAPQEIALGVQLSFRILAELKQWGLRERLALRIGSCEDDVSDNVSAGIEACASGGVYENEIPCGILLVSTSSI